MAGAGGDAPCPGCGLVTPVSTGPTHPYIGASAGCWERYGELLACGVGGQLVADTYAAEHPGTEEHRSAQSVAVHVMSMCARLERSLPGDRAVELIRRALAANRRWSWLPHDLPIGTATVADVLLDKRSIPEWAADVWQAWAPHHETIRCWLDEVPGRRR
jgi:Family of unknown function (DUF5946)